MGKTVPSVREAIEEKRWAEAEVPRVAKVLDVERVLIDAAANGLEKR